ncbi:hypothetical protein EJ08DRAFT_698498 [Tothia fuscella]|uniref:Uncharacterized protein n=1 Tax=Tothia fuscella TaxID=1048955 RepID=A0A9P4NPM5_9PEZI|nr:hypothetical protein EJ08DRAFT_698498 [Tothia fuscella]
MASTNNNNIISVTELYDSGDAKHKWLEPYNWPTAQTLNKKDGQLKSVAFVLMFANGAFHDNVCRIQVNNVATEQKVYQAVNDTFDLRLDLSKQSDRDLIVFCIGGVPFRPEHSRLDDIKPYIVHVSRKSFDSVGWIKPRLVTLRQPLQLDAKIYFTTRKVVSPRVTIPRVTWEYLVHNPDVTNQADLLVSVHKADVVNAEYQAAFQGSTQTHLTPKQRVQNTWRDVIPDMCLLHHSSDPSYIGASELQPDRSSLHPQGSRFLREHDPRVWQGGREWKGFHEMSDALQKALANLSDLTHHNRRLAMELLRTAVTFRQKALRGHGRLFRQVVAQDVNRVIAYLKDFNQMGGVNRFGGANAYQFRDTGRKIEENVRLEQELKADQVHDYLVYHHLVFLGVISA